ncbi:MAG: large conductance mechanosensitive channel protein MscL [Acidimicrobiales bacterium]
MWKEFKAFINQGGVFQTAVGLILALAFKPIVDSVVADLVLPIVARIFSQPDFSALKINLGGETTTVNGTEVQAAIAYGKFINVVISFLIIAFVLFLMVKAYNKATGYKEPEPETGPTEIELLTEIRDSLATR